jgi:hypothetical protein
LTNIILEKILKQLSWPIRMDSEMEDL